MAKHAEGTFCWITQQHVATCNWLDIGTPEDYAQAQNFAVGRLDRLLPERP